MKNSKKEKKGFEIIPEKTLKEELLYLTARHKGGIQSTIELARLCNINKNNYVLDVGCGIGTSCFFLAKQYNCKVLGIEINEKKVEWAKKRAEKEGLDDIVKFRVADAQNLPFENETFDVVFTEAVNVFIKDKIKAFSEYKRVVKPDGYIGLVEGTWIKKPTKEIVNLFIKTNESIYSSGFQGYDFWYNEFTLEGWENLLKKVGLKIISSKFYEPKPQTKLKLMKDIGIKHTIKTYLFLLISPSFRNMMGKKTPKEISEYYGNGIYIAKK